MGFLKRTKDIIKSSYGDSKESPDWGRIVNERHVDRLQSLIETSGGNVICGGVDGIDRTDRFIPPTVISQPKLDAPIMQDEIFGPVLPVLSYKNLDAALDMVKGQETPLALYVYSETSKNVEKVLQECPSGGSCVNSSLEQLMGESMPFGGKGPSGMGCYHDYIGRAPPWTQIIDAAISDWLSDESRFVGGCNGRCQADLMNPQIRWTRTLT